MYGKHMSRNTTEYAKATVGSSGCSYSTLQNYNQNFSLSTMNSGAPVVSGTRSNEVVIVPSYGGTGYSSLTATNGSGQPSCTGHPLARYAYPTEGCNLFTYNLKR
jgi:hypothetical protein